MGGTKQLGLKSRQKITKIRTGMSHAANDTVTSVYSQVCLCSDVTGSGWDGQGIIQHSVHLSVLRSAPVVMRQVQNGLDKVSSKLVGSYTGHCAVSPCDGPRVITLRHEGQGHIKKWPVNCPQCGRELAKLLRQLDVGPRGWLVSSWISTSCQPHRVTSG